MRKSLIYLLLPAMLLAMSCQKSEEEKIQAQKAKLERLKRDVAKLESELKKVGYDADDAALENAKIVTVIKPERTDFRTYLEASGKVTSKTNIMVSAEMGGTLMFLNVKEGSAVRQGQVIGQVDKTLLESNILELKSSMELAQEAYDRQKNLWDQKIGTEFQFLQAKNNLEGLQRRLATLEKQRDKANIVSPISGVIDRVYANTGEMLGAGMPVVQVVNLATIEVEAEISESYLPKVKRGDKIQITFPSIGLTRQTTITALSQVINPGNRTFKVQAELSNSDGKIKPNMLAVVKLTEYTGANKIIVPSKLLQEDMDGKFLHIITGEDEVERRYVTVGYSSDGYSEIDSGLEGDEKVVDLGFRLVTHGDKVRIRE
jgi:membrane fusion protein, multidrug efflux system